ncbi:hypothetical protein [Psychrosphaera algicola]|uniref:Uncharacterized protein n=1 Tax=Psychrosphaera algicola TaxID=3023714 RepID=A0ABT5FIU0_9GAMM|nr:hypothetical protein [Psychrosphaera sp. G1-22]MDC2891101.1 hypothetical protein [Psychrosphaera sp. G1-22]
MFFNVAIALLLMELGIYQTIESMLAVYSVLVLAWLSSLVADLIINKPLGISPKHIEFKRSHLFDINPVGVGSMFIASFVGFTSHFGWYGETAKALASFTACGLPFITVPLIGYLTKGKYYLVDANKPEYKAPTFCYICENTFDQEDITYCPAYKNLFVPCVARWTFAAVISAVQTRHSHNNLNTFLTVFCRLGCCEF